MDMSDVIRAAGVAVLYKMAFEQAPVGREEVSLSRAYVSERGSRECRSPVAGKC